MTITNKREADRPRKPLSAAAGALWRRRQGLAALALLAGLAVLGDLAWRSAKREMRSDPRYQVTAATIQTPDPPPWVRTDIPLEALRDAGLRGGLSVLDPPGELQQRLADAFRFHPWVENVERIEVAPPNRVRIDLAYRQPFAAVEPVEPGAPLAAIDRHGYRLPRGGLTDRQLRYLPRVVRVPSVALPGELWRDRRVQGAVRLVAALGVHWRRLDLVRIEPSRSLEPRGELRYYTYGLEAAGGTRIWWGPAPDVKPPGEPSFEQKLRWLMDYVSENGPLRFSYQTPAEIDLRRGLSIKRRTANKPGGPGEAAEPVRK